MASRKAATKAEKAHMALIASLPCVICGTYPVQVHHLTNCGRRLGHFYTLPLCELCHVGDNGFSGKNRDAWDKSLGNQLKLCQQVYQKLGLEFALPYSKIPNYYERMLES